MLGSSISPYRPALASVRDAILDADPEARTDRARWLGEGWSFAAIRVPSKSGDWVVRLLKPGAWWAPRDLEHEVRLMPLLAQRPFDVAVPRDATILRDAVGAVRASMHRIVAGTPLSESGAPRGHAREELCAGIGRLLSTLHATSVVDAKRHGVREVDLWRDRYTAMVQETGEVLPLYARDWLLRVADDFERQGGSSHAPRVLVHGDISGDHLLLDEEQRLAGVIDFADAAIADPALDFAGVLNHLTWRDLERVWRHYDGEIDEGAIGRTRFYITVAPMFSVLYGEAGAGPDERRRGVRQLIARAHRGTAPGS